MRFTWRVFAASSHVPSRSATHSYFQTGILYLWKITWQTCMPVEDTEVILVSYVNESQGERSAIWKTHYLLWLCLQVDTAGEMDLSHKIQTQIWLRASWKCCDIWVWGFVYRWIWTKRQWGIHSIGPIFVPPSCTERLQPQTIKSC